MLLGKEFGKVRRFLRKEVIFVDRLLLFRFSGDEKGNLEIYMIVFFGLDEKIDFFF